MVRILLERRTWISRPLRLSIVSSLGEVGPMTTISLTFVDHGSTKSTPIEFRAAVRTKIVSLAGAQASIRRRRQRRLLIRR